MLDWLVRTIYANQLKHRSRSAAIVFWLTSQPALAAIVRTLTGFCYGYRLHRVIRQLQPDIVVSTYPLVTGALGYLRGRGKLAMPVPVPKREAAPAAAVFTLALAQSSVAEVAQGSLTLA